MVSYLNCSQFTANFKIWQTNPLNPLRIEDYSLYAKRHCAALYSRCASIHQWHIGASLFASNAALPQFHSLLSLKM